MLREKRLRVGEAPRSNLDTYTVSKEPKKKTVQSAIFQNRGRGERGFVCAECFTCLVGA